MSILDVTEEQIFNTLGKEKIEKSRPIIKQPQQVQIKQTPVYKAPEKPPAPEPVRISMLPEINNHLKGFTKDLKELNGRVDELHKMIKMAIISQFAIILVLLIVLIVRK